MGGGVVIFFTLHPPLTRIYNSPCIYLIGPIELSIPARPMQPIYKISGRSRFETGGFHYSSAGHAVVWLRIPATQPGLAALCFALVFSYSFLRITTSTHCQTKQTQLAYHPFPGALFEYPGKLRKKEKPKKSCITCKKIIIHRE